jgi:hypothetical protein
MPRTKASVKKPANKKTAADLRKDVCKGMHGVKAQCELILVAFNVLKFRMKKHGEKFEKLLKEGILSGDSAIETAIMDVEKIRSNANRLAISLDVE